MNFKALCICASMMCSASAWAQHSVNTTIYGIVDEGVEYVSGVNAGEGRRRDQVRVGWGTYAPRLGFRGSEDLGGGLSAVYQLEMGVSVDTGTAGQGRLFGRQAFVGLSGRLGTVTLGRQYAMRYYALFDADILGPAAHGLGAIDSGIPNARVDNAIAWRGHYGRWSGGANYSVGRDAVNGNNVTGTNCPGEAAERRQCREYSWMLKYDGGKWGVVGAYERQHGGSAGTYAGLTSPDRTDSRATLNAYYRADRTRLGIGILKRDNHGSATPRSDLYWVAAALPLSSNTVIDAMAARYDVDDSANGARYYALRGTLSLSMRTALYVSAAYVDNSGTLALGSTTNAPATGPLPGGTQKSVIAGVRHNF